MSAASVGQRTDGVEAHVAPQLRPDFGANVRHDRGLETGIRQGLRDGLNARRLLAIDFGERKAIALNELYHAGLGDLRCGIDDGSDHAFCRQMIGNHAAGVDAFDAAAFVLAAVAEKIPPGNAVLRRQHHRFIIEQCWQVAHDVSDLMRLHAEDHEILRAKVRDAA
jgi:hypothetical protein